MTRETLFQDTAILFGNTPKQLDFPNIPQPYFQIGDTVREKERQGKYLGTIVGFVEDDKPGKLLIKIKSAKSIAETAGYRLPLYIDDDHPSVCNDRPMGKYLYLFLPLSELLHADKQSVAIEEMAEVVYPDLYHHLYKMRPSPDDSFSQKRNPICWYEGCTKPSVGIGIINVWGTVMPVVMCHEHSHLHGMLFESNPFKRITKE